MSFAMYGRSTRPLLRSETISASFGLSTDVTSLIGEIVRSLKIAVFSVFSIFFFAPKPVYVTFSSAMTIPEDGSSI